MNFVEHVRWTSSEIRIVAVLLLFVFHFFVVSVLLLSTLLPLLVWLTGDKQLSLHVSVMVWFLLSPVVLGYGQLLPGFDSSLRIAGDTRAEGKLKTAPFRFAFIYGAMSSTCLAMAGLSDIWLWPVVIILIVIGYFLGRDHRRRVYELRKRYRDPEEEYEFDWNNRVAAHGPDLEVDPQD